jgi:phosphatidylserine/phosphatidylglycerophosphate/cardiolipin synthase-like enzyme
MSPRSRASARVRARAYLSPTLVLLAFNWPGGEARSDFLGCAIERAPGFEGEAASWLPNRLTFDGPAAGDAPSNESPIQKFMWWDARIDDADRGKRFTYRVVPVVGQPGALELLDADAATVAVKLPQAVVGRIGTYFNRAVVSSQAFVREFGRRPTGAKLDRALAWLANGIETVIPSFVDVAEPVDGAIYHLTDDRWVIPALAARGVGRKTELVYDDTTKDAGTNDAAVRKLRDVEFFPRKRTGIMHDKFLVRSRGRSAQAVLAGSANFTTEGLTTQANVLHTFRSPALAALYLERQRRLEADPPRSEIVREAGWSDPVAVDSASVRVFFPPEPQGERASLDRIVRAVERAASSVVFCIFAPTDAALRAALFAAGDAGKMMFGLVNSIMQPKAGSPDNADTLAKTEIYHRSRAKRDVYSHSLYGKGGSPAGFWWEAATLPGSAGKFPVYIHHKFVVIDAETDHPVIYTGSANMSGNSLWHNDENLLEITGHTGLARTYLAEFMRLYEHYRARAQWDRWHRGSSDTYKLVPDARWAKAAFTEGTPQWKSRLAMVGEE